MFFLTTKGSHALRGCPFSLQYMVSLLQQLLYRRSMLIEIRAVVHHAVSVGEVEEVGVLMSPPAARLSDPPAVHRYPAKEIRAKSPTTL